MFRRLFGGSKARSHHQIAAELRRWAKQEMANGRTRQDVEWQLTREELDQKDPEYGAKLGAYLLVAREIGSVMVERNMRGIELEKRDRIDEAIALYEENVRDGFMGSHPYERLRIIYRKRKDWENALRVCQAAVACPQMDKRKRARYWEWVQKLKAEVKKAS